MSPADIKKKSLPEKSKGPPGSIVSKQRKAGNKGEVQLSSGKLTTERSEEGRDGENLLK